MKAPDEPSTLALKLQRIGNDWQLNWDSTAPFLLKAAAGHLLITDGSIHKSVDLDISDLRNGSVMYTPITNDVALRLDVVSPESVTLASGTARMMAGLSPSPQDLVQHNGGSRDAKAHSEKVTSLDSAPSAGTGGSAIEITSEGSSIARSFPAKATIPLTMSPPVYALGHEIVNFEATVPLPNPTMMLREADTFAPPSMPPAPPELHPNANGSNSILHSSARPVSQSAEAERSGIDRPAELITRRGPVYPELARRSGVSETVQLQFRVGVSGKIENVRVVKGPPVLAQSAVEAVQMWRYNPAQVKGIPVDSEIRTTIIFKLD